jgi:hypothetical protein
MISTVHLDNIVAMDHANRAIKLADAQPSPFVVMALNLRAFGQSVRAAVPGVDPQLAMKARADAERSIAMASAGMHPTWLAGAANLFGQVETNLGDIGAATRWYEEVSQTRHGSATSSIVLPLGLAGLSVTQHLLGHTETALRAALDYEACRTLTFRALPWFQAAALLREAEKVVRKLGLPLAENHLLCIAGVVEHLRGNPDRAARLLAASRRLAGPADRFIPFRTPGHWALHRHYQPLVRATLGAEQGMRAREEGQAMSMDEALAYAMQGLQ